MNNDTADAGFSMLVAAIGLVLLLIIIATSAPAGICLTKQQARELWPKQHIYWFRDKQTGDHCWSNRRGPPAGLKMDPIRKSLAQAAFADEPQKKEPREIRGVKVVSADEYNEIDAQLDHDLFFEAKPFPFWQMVMNMDRYRFIPWHERIGMELK